MAKVVYKLVLRVLNLTRVENDLVARVDCDGDAIQGLDGGDMLLDMGKAPRCFEPISVDDMPPRVFYAARAGEIPTDAPVFILSADDPDAMDLLQALAVARQKRIPEPPQGAANMPGTPELVAWSRGMAGLCEVADTMQAVVEWQ